MNHPAPSALRYFEEVSESIRAEISSGRLQPGDKLPAERQLAAAYGVGRYTVREALRSLEMSGLVNMRKGAKGGAFISQGNAGGVAQSLTDLVSVGGSSLEELTEARTLLLQLAVELVCDRATEPELDAIMNNVEELRQRVRERDADGRLLAIERFFHLIGEATHNRAVLTLVNSMSQAVRPTMIKAGPKAEAGVVDSHQSIAMALASRDKARSKTAMGEHLIRLHKYLHSKLVG
ncbi:MAG: GntR family transcriptional regulator [Burkholderiaceae bacterium]|nr:GntR family transcriptional regulator [Burkholderiaceae bacterium]